MAKLAVGDKAPAFALKDQHGKLVRLSSFKGKRVVVYFYPKADTPGCTQQSCNLQDAFPRVVIDNIQNAEPTPGRQLIGDKVHRPTSVRCIGNRHLHTRSLRQTFPSFRSHLQLLLSVNTVGSLGVYDELLRRQHPVQQRVAVSRILRGQCLQALA